MKFWERGLRSAKRNPTAMLRSEDEKAQSNDPQKKLNHIKQRARSNPNWLLRDRALNSKGWDWAEAQAKKGCQYGLYKPGQGPPWDFATATGPPTIDQPYFLAFQPIAQRARDCWQYYRTALREHRQA